MNEYLKPAYQDDPLRFRENGCYFSKSSQSPNFVENLTRLRETATETLGETTRKPQIFGFSPKVGRLGLYRQLSERYFDRDFTSYHPVKKFSLHASGRFA